MTETTPPVASNQASRSDEMFPTLTAAQIARIAVHGRMRRVQQGEVLVEPGERTTRFFVVTAGQIEIVQLTGETEEIVAVFQPGMFTGEVTMLSGRRGLARIRVSESGEVIQVDREHLLSLVRGLRKDRRTMGPSANVSGVRHNAVLRQLTQPPREQTCAREWTPGDFIGGARRELVVLLSR